MTTGVVLSPNTDTTNCVDDIIAQAKMAHGRGVRQVWLAQQLDYDAITLAALIGAAVPGLGVGTSVVPINPRHPLVVASLAQTAQAASHGAFSLGLGLGAHSIEQDTFGISPANTIRRLREHLTVLRSVLIDGSVDFRGQEITASPGWPVRVAGGVPISIYVAAMGPKALQVSGELADGTMPYLAGPRTLEDFIVPTITRAAADVGRPRPRILAAVPVLVTGDAAAGQAEAASQLAFYDRIPSYQKVIAREGVSGAADLALVGTHDAVIHQLGMYRDAGATDLILSPLRRNDEAALQAVWDVAAAL
ncbi:MAG TPA: LLM class F420-dependent oxidoreductase [Mycobacterium sp.]